MHTILSRPAKRNGTYIIIAEFTDEDGDSVVPTSISWTLTDLKGRVINERENVSVSVPDSSINIILQGDDLCILNDEKKQANRIVLVKSLYDSDLGEDLPSNAQVQFPIEDLIKTG